MITQENQTSKKLGEENKEHNNMTAPSPQTISFLNPQQVQAHPLIYL